MIRAIDMSGTQLLLIRADTLEIVGWHWLQNHKLEATK